MIHLLFAAAALAAQDVNLTTDDGVRLHASARPAPGAKRGVVLVHMQGRSATDWDHLAEKLARADFAVIAPDLRGHGPQAAAAPADEDYPRMVADVKAASAWLRAQGVSDVSCAGAGLGANLCLRAAAEDPGIVNAVLLSPGLNFKGVTSGDAIAPYGDRPLLIVASKEDSYAARTAQVLDERATGQRHLELLEAAGSGTKMLNREPALEGMVISWLLGTFQLASGDVVRPRPAIANDPAAIETTGKKLDAHR